VAVLEIVKYGDPILSKVCNPVEDFPIHNGIIQDMYDSMYEADGIGLAANQVGLDMNLFIVDISHTEETNETFEFINGKILETWGQSSYAEGCLSIPEVALEVERPEKILFSYQTIDGDIHENEFDGLLSRAIQHEVDHLNGRLIVDRVSSIARLQFKKQLSEIKRIAREKSRNQKGQSRYVL
jgi:peptide deformylase